MKLDSSSGKELISQNKKARNMKSSRATAGGSTTRLSHLPELSNWKFRKMMQKVTEAQCTDENRDLLLSKSQPHLCIMKEATFSDELNNAHLITIDQ